MNEWTPISYVLILFSAMIFFVVGFDYLAYNVWTSENQVNSIVAGLMFDMNIYGKYLTADPWIRFASTVLMCGAVWMIPPGKKRSMREPKNRTLNGFLLVGFAGLYWMGFISYSMYDRFLFPIIFIVHLILIFIVIGSYKKKMKDQIKLGISTYINAKYADHNFSFNVKADDEEERLRAMDGEGKFAKAGIIPTVAFWLGLVINNPFQGIWIEGSPGSGKSASIIEKIHHDAIQKGYSGVIYDYKGPALTRAAYNYWLSSEKKQKFKPIDFLHPWWSYKTNPIHPDILTNDLLITEAADGFMKNLNKKWLKDADFWANNAIAMVKAGFMYLKEMAPEMCDIPHAISFLLSDYEVVLEALSNVESIAPHIAPVIVAYNNRAEGQLSGVVSSYQLPLGKLWNKEIYWTLSPTADDYEEDLVVSLDVSNKKDPTLISICAGGDEYQEALSPVISVIMSIVKTKVNKKGNNPTLYSVDELPTIYIPGLDVLPATGRSNLVCTVTALQDYSQLEDNMGDKKAERMMSSMTNRFYGLASNDKAAKRTSESLGKVKRVDISYTTSRGSGGPSVGEKRQLENVRETDEVGTQVEGHFMGKISNGRPALFSGQFEYFEGEYKNSDNAFDEDLPYIYPSGYAFEKTQNPDMDLLESVYEESMKSNFERVEANIKELLAPFTAIIEQKRNPDE